MLTFCLVDLEVAALSLLFTRRGRHELSSQARKKFDDQSIVGTKEHEELLPTYKQAMASDELISYGWRQICHQKRVYL
jgi:hypothetical protein